MMSNSDDYIKILIAVLVIIVFILFVLVAVYFLMKRREKKLKKQENDIKLPIGERTEVKKSEKEYTRESIFDFMEFEKIDENMIIQKNGKFIMIIECQGINFDLMPEMEKVSVEQGFLEFLNTLRYPIQIYVQTRTVNLEKSISRYKQKLQIIERNYTDARLKYDQSIKSATYNENQKQKVYYDMVKQKNLYDYTQDIINNIERTSKNSRILNKKYYIIVQYNKSEMDTENYSNEEIQNMAFSELYTRCKSIINTLFSTQVTGKILDTEGLIELLYSAYNRDESDVLSSQKALAGGFEERYSTAPDIIDKKMKALDREIERQAVELANNKIEETYKEIEYRRKMEDLQTLVKELAQGMLEHDKSLIGEDIAKQAIESIEKDKKQDDNTSQAKEKGGINQNVQEKTKKRRGRPTKGISE